MVDAIVSYVLTRVDYLIKEAVFLGRVKKEVELLKNELQWMKCFIKDAEEKQVNNAIIGQWVSDVRDIAYDTEDVLDTFILEIYDRENSNMVKVNEEGTSTMPDVNEGTLRRQPRFFASIKKCCCIFSDDSSNQESSHRESTLYTKGKDMLNLYSIGKEIEELRKRINDISRKREVYGLENISNKKEGEYQALDRLKQLRRATSFSIEDNVVGFEDDTNKLLVKLLDRQPQRILISIFGMGGLGKTTLARKLYHNNDVKRKFNCYAWVSVSQDYTTQDLLLRLIKSFKIRITKQELEKMNEEDLERCLHEYLQGCSYLVVIDDAWQKEVWKSLKRAFPDNKNGSRVIITTRIKEVAERSDEITYFHRLRFLRPDESWQLFCQKAFRETNVDEGLETLGREMVQKCDGLPLAIVVLGGLLSAKRPQDWRLVRDHIWRHLKNDSIEISYLFTLSFNDLSHQLKLCFLYLCLFPEDSEINIEKLIQLLVAEGFTAQVEDQILEEVAKDNLDELINRSLVQIDKRCWGRVATCKVHDLLRNLANDKAKELNLIHVCDEIKQSTCFPNMESCRRQAIYSGEEKCFWLQHGNPLSRSLLFFNQKWDESFKIAQHLAPLCTRFRLLRVLNVQGSPSRNIIPGRSLPKALGKLIHLKYLGLRNAYIYRFPSSIVNLKRLQTLDLYGTDWYLKLPTEIHELQELRHLTGKFTGPLSIDNLENLQTLKYVNYESWIMINPEKLVNVRELQIYGYQAEDEMGFATFDSFAKLRSLQSLTVNVQSFYYFSSLHPLAHCKYLIHLRLCGKMVILPRDMHRLLPNLECLSLANSELGNDPMPILEKLPNLMILDLNTYFYSGTQLICRANGFARLEILQLHLSEEQEWQVAEEAMPMLRGLKIPETFKQRIPLRLRSIPPPGEWECDTSWLYGGER